MVKNLSIEIVRRSPKLIQGIPYALAKIKIEEFWEQFNLRIDWWTVEDYESQWQMGLERLKSHHRSCLVTEVVNPQLYQQIAWWLLYKEDNLIYIRNEVLFGEYYAEVVGQKKFTPQTCYDFIGPKQPRAGWEDGHQESEWVILYE